MALSPLSLVATVLKVKVSAVATFVFCSTGDPCGQLSLWYREILLGCRVRTLRTRYAYGHVGTGYARVQCTRVRCHMPHFCRLTRSARHTDDESSPQQTIDTKTTFAKNKPTRIRALWDAGENHEQRGHVCVRGSHLERC